ncbi:MAG: class I SAM-dependent methyltransferase [Candidatus Acidiferrales bacterium]
MATTEQQTFYDQHPFDWVSADAPEAINSVVSPPLVDFIQTLGVESLVLDVGCGPGRVLGFLARRGIRCIGLDRSRVSLALAVERYGRPGTVGDNLHLPFADGIADAVISDGVIHHTDNPQAAFIENFRVLKPGGRMYLAVYKPSGRYPLLYKIPGAWIRAGLRHGWSSPFVVLFFRIPYFLVHFVRSKGARTWAAARNLFYDYFVTPQVAFLPRQTVQEWCAAQGARVLHYQENPGQNVHSFLLLKERARPEQPRAGGPAPQEIAVAEKQETA